jgi:hypothetical protein
VGIRYTSPDPSPCKRLKDGNGADMTTVINLSRSRKLWPRTANLRRESCDWAQLRNFRSHMSSSVEILAGISIHLPNFSDLPTPPTYIHAPQNIPTQSTKSILGGPAISRSNGHIRRKGPPGSCGKKMNKTIGQGSWPPRCARLAGPVRLPEKIHMKFLCLPRATVSRWPHAVPGPM